MPARQIIHEVCFLTRRKGKRTESIEKQVVPVILPQNFDLTRLFSKREAIEKQNKFDPCEVIINQGPQEDDKNSPSAAATATIEGMWNCLRSPLWLDINDCTDNTITTKLTEPILPARLRNPLTQTCRFRHSQKSFLFGVRHELNVYVEGKHTVHNIPYGFQSRTTNWPLVNVHAGRLPMEPEQEQVTPKIKYSINSRGE